MKVSVVGFPRQRAELLTAALSNAAPGRFRFELSESPPESFTPAALGGSSVFFYGGEMSGSGAAVALAERLRTESLFWEPVHVFMNAAPRSTNFAEEWSLYFHSLPPDVSTLAASVSSAGPVSQQRRAQITLSALGALADDLNSLVISLAGAPSVSPDRLRACAADVLEELTTHALGEHVLLRRELERVRGLPAVSDADLSKITALAVEAERAERERADRRHLLSSLHVLNNVARLAARQPDAGEELLPRIRRRLGVLRERGVGELPAALRGECSEIISLLARELDGEGGVEVTPERERLLAEQLPRLYRAASSARPSGTGGAASVERIVVVEDDPDWRRRIVESLKVTPGAEGVEVQEAATLVQAQALLRSHCPALVLVDLGLPPEEGADILLDAGLALIKQFAGPDKQGRRYQHRFVVLTAAENYAEAVREALGFGVSPTSYLQKEPHTWEHGLRAQVVLALQPLPARPPNIELFKRTGRVARVEGLEIKLDHPQWCLLATLAERRRGAWNEPERLAHVLYWNYSLNPEARSAESDDLDPKDRILLQLPHYASDLRLRLGEAYTQALHRAPPADILAFDETAGYRLNANARVLGRVDEHFNSGRRPSVLVVEDTREWGAAIMRELSCRGFEARWARWTDEARRMMAEEVPDLVSLDLELPTTEAQWSEGAADASGAVEFLEDIRRDYAYMPVAILTAVPWRDREMLQILRRGVRVDDYLPKHGSDPLGRLTNSLARLWQESIEGTRILHWDATLPVHPITIDPESKTLIAVAGHPVRPAGQGVAILRSLSATPNNFVSRSELILAVYGEADEDDDGPEDLERALNQHIKRLRKAITDATGGRVPGDQVVCGDRGIYWLRGVVQ